MAVQPQTPYIEHIANGTTTGFNLGFDCDDQDHLIVLVNDVESVVGAWSLNGGAVVFTVAPAVNKKITIQRNTPFERERDYQSYDNSFRPPAVNKDFDWIWFKLQELGVADWILGNRIDALKNYVDRKDDELKAYLMEEIRKQGVALDQLDDYYNYLMQRLAQIAVDKGWDASFVVYHGQNQKQFNDNLIHLVANIAALREVSYIPLGLKVHVKEHSVVTNEGGGNFQSFYSETPLTDNNGTLIKTDVVPNLYWKRVDFQAVTPEMFGAQALIDEDQAPFFNAMYLASELEGFLCGSVKGRRYRVYTEVDIRGANATYGFTEFRLRSNNARVRIRAKSRARFFDVETNSGFTGNVIYLNGLDGWGAEFQNNMFDDLRLRCPTITGTAIYLDCTEVNTRIAYAHSTNVRIEGFENGLYLHAAAPSGFSFINANTFTNYMAGAQCKNFIKMIANKNAGGVNDVDSNKIISTEFQNKNGDNALIMIGCKLNQLLGQTYFDLTTANAVYIDETSENNFIQGAWIQTHENISSKNTVINQNNSITYKSYQKNRTTFSTEYIERERFILTPNMVDPVANEGSYFKTANTQGTTYTRFRNLLEGKVVSIYVNDDFTAFTNSAYISIKSKGNDLKAVKGCIYNFKFIDGVAVLDADTFHTTNASASISTGTQVFGPSNATPLGRNTKWARIVCDDGIIRMIPVWNIPAE